MWPPLDEWTKTEQKLFDAVQSRKGSVSAGVDGWRTPEVKALPLRAFSPWARLWNAIETQQMTFPECLKQARLVMLPKPDAKSAQPIHRRLISLLNIFCLAYSRARFVDTIPYREQRFLKRLLGEFQEGKALAFRTRLLLPVKILLSRNTPFVVSKLIVRSFSTEWCQELSSH